MGKKYILLITVFLLLVLTACGSDEENADEIKETDNVSSLDELSHFEEEVKEIVLNQVGFKDEDGNDRIENIMGDNGEFAEETIKKIEQDENQDDLDTDTKAMLREKIVNVTINSTQDEYGRSVDSAHIFQELYDNYDLDKVSISWNMSDVPDEDASMIYVLKKRTEADLNWEDVFEEFDSGTISSFNGFTKDIDTFIDWPIE